jgi:Tol biopolymer transport system component
MAKEPDERFQNAHDVKLQLMSLAQAASAPTTRGKKSSPVVWIAMAAVILVLLVTISFLVHELRNPPASSGNGVTRFSIVLPPRQELAVNNSQAVVLSPDGRYLAYVAAENGVPRLYTRLLDQFDSVAISDSEGTTFPFFSPNGDWVAFFSQRKLKKAPSNGGVTVVICEMPTFFGRTWTPQDVSVVDVPNYGLASVPGSGGSLQKISVATKDIIYPQGPASFAGGEWIAFSDFLSNNLSVMAVKLKTGELRTLVRNAQSASFSDGRLMYFQGGTLWAVPFDPLKATVQGDAIQIQSGIAQESYIAQASTSESGVLAYAPGPAGSFSRNMYLVNRNGKEQKLDIPARDYVDPAISPDGTRIACMFRSVAGQQLAVLDRERGLFNTLVSSGLNAAPAWMADGKTLLFDRVDDQRRAIYRISADGSSAPQVIRTISLNSHVTSASGEYAAITVNDPVTSADLWLLSLRNPEDMRPFKNTTAAERQGSLSPDGHWMAYVSNESGRPHVSLESVPGPGGRWQVSNEGGEERRWVRNGPEITYRNGTKMMSVPVQVQPALQVGRAIELFDRKFDRGFGVAGYDVTPDGQTFVMTRSEHPAPTEIRVVVGWPGTLLHE